MNDELENIYEYILDMNINDAKVYVDKLGYSMRVTKKDNESYLCTADLRSDRINVHLDRFDFITNVSGLG